MCGTCARGSRAGTVEENREDQGGKKQSAIDYTLGSGMKGVKRGSGKTWP